MALVKTKHLIHEELITLRPNIPILEQVNLDLMTNMMEKAQQAFLVTWKWYI